jgi:hypothetical protein
VAWPLPVNGAGRVPPPTIGGDCAATPNPWGRPRSHPKILGVACWLPRPLATPIAWGWLPPFAFKKKKIKLKILILIMFFFKKKLFIYFLIKQSISESIYNKYFLFKSLFHTTFHNTNHYT